MKIKTIAFLLLILFFKTIDGFGQDLIIQKNGTKIYCKILKEDSVLITYKKNQQADIFNIKKADIEKYYISTVSNLKNAEKNKKRMELFNIIFFGGQSNPYGKFASKKLSDVESGLANSGYVLQMSAILKTTENFGFSVSYLYQTNNFDDKIIRDQLSVDYTNAQFETKSTDWKVKGLFGGMHLNFPVKSINGFSFHFDVKGGNPKCTLPFLQITGKPFGTLVTVKQFEAFDRSLAFLGGMGFRYKLYKNLAINLNVQTLYTKPFFSNIRTISTNNYTSLSDYGQKISTLNVEAGLCFIIYNKKQ